MGVMFRELDESQVQLEDLFVILGNRPSVIEKPDAKEYEYKGGNIEFRNVHYSYPKSILPQRPDTAKNANDNYVVRENLFDGLSLKIEKGTTNAIVGPSGFGKTTLFNLLFRIYDPTQGEVYVDGQNLKDMKIKGFRQHITIVPQNGILFNDTILYNLKYGRPDASLEDIIEVAKQCQIHDRIMEMPDGYDTNVGDLGSKLSGGERQRLLIARALLKKADIYLFDEATSSLDSHNEKLITEQLENILVGKTAIFCAHRLSSVMGVDKIHVLGGGKVVESGSHNKLLSNPNSAYSQMWKNYLRSSIEEIEKVEEELKLDERVDILKESQKEIQKEEQSGKRLEEKEDVINEIK